MRTVDENIHEVCHLLQILGATAAVEMINEIAVEVERLRAEVAEKKRETVEASMTPAADISNPCTCIHAPEQHGPAGCNVVRWDGAVCACPWDGRLASALAPPVVPQEREHCGDALSLLGEPGGTVACLVCGERALLGSQIIHKGPFRSAPPVAQPSEDVRAMAEEAREEYTLADAAENLVEYVDMLLFTLTDGDQHHQDHAREMVEGWAAITRKALARAVLATKGAPAPDTTRLKLALSLAVRRWNELRRASGIAIDNNCEVCRAFYGVDPGQCMCDAGEPATGATTGAVAEDQDCSSCGEECAKPNECPQSKRQCGHHCNHSWSHDGCCWCGAEFGEDSNA